MRNEPLVRQKLIKEKKIYPSIHHPYIHLISTSMSSHHPSIRPIHSFHPCHQSVPPICPSNPSLQYILPINSLQFILQILPSTPSLNLHFYSFIYPSLLYRRESILAIDVFPRQKIIMYNEFGVLLACENVGKILAVRRACVMTVRECRVDRPFPYPLIRFWVRTRPPPPAVWALSRLFKPAFEA
jgi:hypothetical protein